MIRRCVPVLVVGVLALYGTPAAAQEATSTAIVVTSPGGFGLPHVLNDGEPCTGVPNSTPGVFDFTSACEAHDQCYAGGVDRLACDVEFRADLIESCVVQHPDAFNPARYVCVGLAELYFAGVRLFGGFFFPS